VLEAVTALLLLNLDAVAALGFQFKAVDGGVGFGLAVVVIFLLDSIL
jgi:hypothetical protein